MNSSHLITLPARLAARGVGFARGTLSEGRRLVREATTPAAEGEGVTAGHRDPVNVHDELGLDPAPPARSHTPRQPAVTGIDQQAEPGLVESTPADVAARLGRAGDDDR